MPLAAARAVRAARRLYPLAVVAYRRWQTLSPAEKERYLAMARQYANRGRGAVDQARARRRGGGPPGPPARS
ncbi:MAG: hypothetical protein H0V03_04555 [Thermoleophilaceae bacterium]|nr:hypothetical protein [Thermoleophilaceae bacterium]